MNEDIHKLITDMASQSGHKVLRGLCQQNNLAAVEFVHDMLNVWAELVDGVEPKSNKHARRRLSCLCNVIVNLVPKICIGIASEDYMEEAVTALKKMLVMAEAEAQAESN